ncbi:hypothetical protein EDD85DRAFT_865998 [Armillaria nabsnona]|nr:hypothetical protein EDD85DRAFT_865998 [Armillaria nabsnona]
MIYLELIPLCVSAVHAISNSNLNLLLLLPISFLPELVINLAYTPGSRTIFLPLSLLIRINRNAFLEEILSHRDSNGTSRSVPPPFVAVCPVLASTVHPVPQN